jgi:hypothetical protein
MCFNNFHNRFGSMQISLSFGVSYDGEAPGGTKEEQQKEEEEEARQKLNSTLAVIEVRAELKP